ncbi:O-Antigen ligase [Butyrivibrio sp. ob235]|uniref:O-antigen ligase family protein n=1 Tax=Butyrivibrio sp. ob235 TaxID=1761780 RepID=UPI0008B63B7B|nr:O-antigen ligase family protein [Butyrivibrio sp. ob235]SEL59226.1 O-Antigen ligase [Butyrivibrio sp. ob235]
MRQKDKTTAQVIHEYGELLTKYYLVVMFVVLPLYYQNGYSDIANSKYILYRLVSTAFLIITGLVCFLVETACEKTQNVRKKPILPIIFVTAHLIFNLLTWVFAVDHKIAWRGNGSWHMGLLSQILFLGSMLLVYYYYSDKYLIWIAAAIGAVLTGILTILNRIDIYPIDMGNKYPGFISTLGQTNWATIYTVMLIGAGIGLFVYEEKPLFRYIILVLNCVVIAGAWMAGSDTFLPAMFFELFIMFGICLKKRDLMKRFSEFLLAFGIATEFVYVFVFVLFHDRFVFVDEQDAVNTLLKMHIGLIIIVGSLIILGIMQLTKNKEWNKKLLEIAFRVLVCLMLIALAVTVVLMVVVTTTPEKAGAFANIRMLNFDDDWGTHRGLNWKCSIAGFIRMSPIRKVIGMGQGSFNPLMQSFPDLQARLEAMYEGFALMVAHNEYLNMLIENGILGCLSYIGVLVSSFALLWKRAEEHRLSLMALLALSGYIACSFFFFQHVYATSFMYIFIAIALSEIRGEKA